MPIGSGWRRALPLPPALLECLAKPLRRPWADSIRAWQFYGSRASTSPSGRFFRVQSRSHLRLGSSPVRRSEVRSAPIPPDARSAARIGDIYKGTNLFTERPPRSRELCHQSSDCAGSRRRTPAARQGRGTARASRLAAKSPRRPTCARALCDADVEIQRRRPTRPLNISGLRVTKTGDSCATFQSCVRVGPSVSHVRADVRRGADSGQLAHHARVKDENPAKR